MGHQCPRDYGKLIWEASQKAAEFVAGGGGWGGGRNAELACSAGVQRGGACRDEVQGGSAEVQSTGAEQGRAEEARPTRS